jgi:membrane fusion protein, multidrug efflux system
MNALVRKMSIVGAAAILVAGVVGMKKLGGSAEPENANTVDHVKQVNVFTVELGEQPVRERLTGKVSAARRVMLVAEVPGQVMPSGREIKEGDRFAEGEWVFRIDDSEVQMGLVAQRSQLLTAIAQMLPDLGLDFASSLPTWTAYLAKADERKLLPDLPEMADDKERRFLTSRGIPTQFYNIRSVEARLTKFGFRAPFAATVSKGNLVPGTHVMAGQQLGELIDASAFEFETTISAALAARVKVGTSINVFHADDTLKARVVRISDRVDERTQSVVLFASLAGNALRDGEYLSGELRMTPVSDAALLHGRHLVHGDHVLTIGADTVLSLMPVNIIFRDGDRVVCTGLEDGTRVLDNPFPEAHEGMKVALAKGE